MKKIILLAVATVMTISSTLLGADGVRVNTNDTKETVQLIETVEEVKVDNEDIYSNAKSIEEYGDLFKGRYNEVSEFWGGRRTFEKIIIVHLKDLNKYESDTGNIISLTYKDGKLYLKEKAEYFKDNGACIYVADSKNGLDRLRDDRKSKTVEGITISVLREVDGQDYLKYKNFKSYKFKGNAEYFVMPSHQEGIGLAIPVSEVIGK